MSEVLEVAKALSRASDTELERIIGIRLMPSANFKDFFDFAAALVKPQNMKGAVAGLTSNQIIAFSNLLNNKSAKADQPSLEVLAKLFLVHKQDQKYLPLETAKLVFRQLVSTSLVSKLSAQIETEPELKPVNVQLVDPLAGIGAFETVQAITELVIELEHRYVPEVGRGGVGQAEYKRLASFLGKETKYAESLYELARISGLTVLYHKRWRVGPNYQHWLASSIEDRWVLLAKSWLHLIGPESATELSNETNLKQAIKKRFPLATDGITSHMTNLISLAELIGLTANSEASSWFRPALLGDTAKAKSLITEHLPEVQNKLIVQADLTVISTGPLDTQNELMIRRFVDIERIGVASSYRMSALSLTFGMETGLTESDIRATLKKLSGKDLPQPVDYLIRETAGRFGRLTLKQKTTGTLIEAKDAILITSILNDSELKALALIRIDEHSLETRFDQEVVYYQLRENKYPAIALSESGKVITSWISQEEINLVSQEHSIQADIARWREHDRRLGENPMGDDIIRSLELAIKNKATIQVTIEEKKLQREYTLSPTGLANGRLRAKDKRADCERVLPLASIVSVVIS